MFMLHQLLSKFKDDFSLSFQTKLNQALEMLLERYHAYSAPMLVVADSWFGNNGLWAPLHKILGADVHLLSRLRSNINLNDLNMASGKKKRGRPRKYGAFLGNVSALASRYRDHARLYNVNLYGRSREVMAFDGGLKFHTSCSRLMARVRCRASLPFVHVLVDVHG